ncbi:TetR/AcrR family transcriptional regulator [Sphingopyxis sp. OAS728]|uniref:TetR/AcrR family transcriptional regulator n=1 Tax=Sphingopyxis sp. OAS728 TaxID=2663823 RepID=UPI00178A2F6E|nr:TetR/AcrR family transcriptional regulator [Sphingopyxis sp. OAS728]
MARIKTPSDATATRGEPVRQRVIDAAERLLREGKAEFSMRDLASEAGVSFATPFNQFGSKAAIMHALAERRIELMAKRFSEHPTLANATDRVLLAIRIAAEGMLEEPRVNRAVMGWIGTAGPAPGRALELSTGLWRLALGDGNGLVAASRDEALRTLPRQLAFAFRGTLSFWTAGELPDEELTANAQDVASGLLQGFAANPDRL